MRICKYEEVNNDVFFLTGQSEILEKSDAEKKRSLDASPLSNSVKKFKLEILTNELDTDLPTAVPSAALRQVYYG